MVTINRVTVDQPYVVDKDGRKAVAAYETKAISRVQAELNARGVGLIRGAVYRDVDGSVPDLALRCATIQIEPLNVEGIADVSWYSVLGIFEPATMSSFRHGVEIAIDGAAVWTTEGSLSSMPADRDRLGNAIVNTAKIPVEGISFPTPNEFQIAEWIRSNTNYFAAVALSRKFRGYTNSTAWKGADPREVLCHGLTPEALDNAAFSGGGLVKFTGRFEFANGQELTNATLLSPDNAGGFKPYVGGKTVPGFSVAVLSRGTLELNPNFREFRGGTDFDPKYHVRYRPIMGRDENGRPVPVQEPVLLDESGFASRLSNPTPVAIVYEPGKQTDFNQLGI